MDNADKGSTDPEMAENSNETDHPWNTLETIIAFDRGNNATPILHVDNIRENQDNMQIVPAEPTTSNSIIVSSLVQQLCIMLEGDKVQRNRLYHVICDKMCDMNLIDNSYKMMEFESLRGKCQEAIYHLVTVARSAAGAENIIHPPSLLPLQSSRYSREFQEIEFIASGGFGHVFKALHRLDGIEYAIKKISVPSSRLKTIIQYQKEVKTLAQLNHQNITQYKSAWIELAAPSSFISNVPPTISSEDHTSTREDYTKDSKSENSQSTKDSYNNSISNLNLVDMMKKGSKQDMFLKTSYTFNTSILNKQEDNISSSVSSRAISSHKVANKRLYELNSSTNIIEEVITEENSQESSQEDSHIVSFKNSKSSESRSQAAKYVSSPGQGGSQKESSSFQEVGMCSRASYVSTLCSNGMNSEYMTLYIQMTLYEQTLKQWICKRTSVTPLPVVTAIFEQIVSGLNYIHSHGFTHHDIKSNNIFITTTEPLRIHIGDFGLACSSQNKKPHSAIGTQMYAAPEQLQGECNSKSDIYSTGIVLTELLFQTETQMELIDIIKSLKDSNIPRNCNTNEERKWAQLVIQLIRDNPTERPSAKQLLQNLNEEKDVMIANLKSDNLNKDNMIKELEKKVALLQEEKLKKLEISPENVEQ